MTTIRAFFLQIRALFSNFRKKAGETSPPAPPSSYTPVMESQLYTMFDKKHQNDNLSLIYLLIKVRLKE